MTLDPEAGARLRAFMEPRIGAVQPWAERHGIGRDTIYALWRGRQPSPATVSVLADALGVSYDELLRVRAGIEASEDADLTRVLIAEQRATREMLERVLSSLTGHGLRPDELALIRAEARAEVERLSQGSDDPAPRKPRSSPAPAGHPMRRQGDSA